MRAHLLAAGAVASTLLLATAGCGSSDPTDGSSDSAKVQPQYPTNYMDAAITRWQNRTSGFGGKAWQPVLDSGRTWSGDPATYEKVCGATFLVGGETPDLLDSRTGQKVDDVSKSYYAWLQSDPKRWSAFNSWLSDPAIVAALSDNALNGTSMAERVGDTSKCPDAVGAGTPVS